MGPSKSERNSIVWPTIISETCPFTYKCSINSTYATNWECISEHVLAGFTSQLPTGWPKIGICIFIIAHKWWHLEILASFANKRTVSCSVCTTALSIKNEVCINSNRCSSVIDSAVHAFEYNASIEGDLRKQSWVNKLLLWMASIFLEIVAGSSRCTTTCSGFAQLPWWLHSNDSLLSTKLTFI